MAKKTNHLRNSHKKEKFLNNFFIKNKEGGDEGNP
jgi:hypothetical protein